MCQGGGRASVGCARGQACAMAGVGQVRAVPERKGQQQASLPLINDSAALQAASDARERAGWMDRCARGRCRAMWRAALLVPMVWIVLTGDFETRCDFQTGSPRS